MSRITFDDVSDAIRRIIESGGEPSAPKIRALLGDRGGMSTIQKHLEAWRATEDAGALEATLTPEMPETLLHDCNTLLRQIWNKSLLESEKGTQAEREGLSKAKEKMKSDMAEVIAVSDSQEQTIENLEAELSRSKLDLESMTEKEQLTKEKLADLSTQNAILTERCNQLEKAAEDHKTLEAKLFSQIESMTKELAEKTSKS